MRNIEKHWDIENIEQFFNILTPKHWIKYNVNVENKNIENLLNVDVNVNFFNVSMFVTMFNVDLQTLNTHVVWVRILESIWKALLRKTKKIIPKTTLNNWYFDTFILRQDGGYHVEVLHKDLTTGLAIDSYSTEVGKDFSIQVYLRFNYYFVTKLDLLIL